MFLWKVNLFQNNSNSTAENHTLSSSLKVLITKDQPKHTTETADDSKNGIFYINGDFENFYEEGKILGEVNRPH